MELPPVGERPSLPVERFETAIRSGDRKDAAACIKELAEWFSRMRCWCRTIEEMSILPSNGYKEGVFLRNMADDLLLETERGFGQRAAQAGDNRMEQIVR